MIPKLMERNGVDVAEFCFKSWLEEHDISVEDYAKTVGLSKAIIRRRIVGNRFAPKEVGALLRIIGKFPNVPKVSECFSRF